MPFQSTPNKMLNYPLYHIFTDPHLHLQFSLIFSLIEKVMSTYMTLKYVIVGPKALQTFECKSNAKLQ